MFTRSLVVAFGLAVLCLAGLPAIALGQATGANTSDAARGSLVVEITKDHNEPFVVWRKYKDPKAHFRNFPDGYNSKGKKTKALTLRQGVYFTCLAQSGSAGGGGPYRGNCPSRTTSIPLSTPDLTLADVSRVEFVLSEIKNSGKTVYKHEGTVTKKGGDSIAVQFAPGPTYGALVYFSWEICGWEGPPDPDPILATCTPLSGSFVITVMEAP